MSLLGKDIAARRKQLEDKPRLEEQLSGAGITSEHRQAVLDALEVVLGSSASSDPLHEVEAVVQAEAILSAFLSIVAQRRLSTIPTLELADAAARSGYLVMRQRALALGLEPRRLGKLPIPLVVVEAMATPATFVRERRATVPGFLARRAFQLPFPLVFCPPHPMSSAGSLVFVQHEIGHDVDHDLGLDIAVAESFERVINAGMDRDVTQTWREWAREIVADVLGLFLAGTAVIEELASLSRLLPVPREVSATHPPPALRVALLQELLSLLPGMEPIEVDTTRLDASWDRLGNEAMVRAAAQAILATALPGLDSAARVRHLAGDLPLVEKRVRAAVASLEAGATSQTEIAQALLQVPSRAIPSVLRLSPATCESTHLPAAVHETLANRPLDAASAQHGRFARTILEHVRAPITDAADDTLKRPPPSLFESSAELAFVGASNDSLPALFTSWKGEPKLSIEVFYLDERTLVKLAHAGRSAADLLEGRRRSLDALRRSRVLRKIAERAHVYEHDEPFVFGAYYDAHAAGGRIHVSPAAWGQDVTRAPALDYVWSPTAAQPARVYQFYLDALAVLRSRAREIAL